MMILRFVAFGMFGASLMACSFQENKLPEDSGLGTTKGLNSFAALSANVLVPKCVQCHRGPDGDGGVDLSSYEAIMAGRGLVLAGTPSRSTIYTEVESGSMPDGGPRLSAAEVKAIGDWILAGAPNGQFLPPEGSITPIPPAPAPIPEPRPNPAPVPPAPPAGPKYADVQKRLFDQYCVKCHNATKTKGQVNLASYAELMKSPKQDLVVAGMADRSLVYKEIIRGSMPPRGTVAAEDLAILRDWINHGAKND